MLRYELSQQRALRSRVLIRRGLSFSDHCTMPYVRLCHHRFSTHSQRTVRGECNIQQIFKRNISCLPDQISNQRGFSHQVKVVPAVSPLVVLHRISLVSISLHQLQRQAVTFTSHPQFQYNTITQTEVATFTLFREQTAKILTGNEKSAGYFHPL